MYGDPDGAVISEASPERPHTKKGKVRKAMADAALAAHADGRLEVALGLFSPLIRESIEMLYEFDKPWRVSSAKFEARFGWAATPLDQAVRESLAAARAAAA